MRNIEFVSYDGKYPNLCGGTLTLRVDGEIFETWYCLESGGDWEVDGFEEHVFKGPWSLNRWKFDGFSSEELKEIERLVNKNVEWGCCGGCI